MITVVVWYMGVDSIGDDIQLEIHEDFSALTDAEEYARAIFHDGFLRADWNELTATNGPGADIEYILVHRIRTITIVEDE